MKTILAIFLIVSLILPVSSFGEIQTITHTVKQPFGGSQSPDDARISAVAKAKREALEMAGTYIESLTVVKDYQVDKDEILALSAGVLKAEVVSQKNYASDDTFGINVIVKVVVDTSVLEERVKKLLQDRTHLEKLNQARAREKELLKKIAVLEGENRKSGKSDQRQATLKKEFQEASRGLTAIGWFDKATALWNDREFKDPPKAIEYLTNSINLKPDLVEAYLSRGAAYVDLGQHQRAIEDFDKAISLKPDLAEAYYNRGTVYGLRLGQHQKAIEDFDKAISLNPDLAADTYNNRGLTYQGLGQHKRAIEDYNQAIRLKPDYSPYYNRGIAYKGLGQHQKAIEDFDKAISLKPDYDNAYIIRGNVYANLGQNQRAIEDYNQAIRLKPDIPDAYNNRGNAYKNLGEHQRAIEDYNQAIRMKPDYAVVYTNRGIVYRVLGQYQRAIEDYSEAIRLKPDYADAYGKRGNAYLLQGKNNLGCSDEQKACSLGECQSLEWAKSKGYCR